MDRATAVRDAVDPVIQGQGLHTVEVTITPAGRRRVVRVVVDRTIDISEVVSTPTDPLTLDEIADATRAVSQMLDADDHLLGAAPYTLEVTSPGVGRPLTSPGQIQRNVGRLLTVTPTQGEPFTGRLRSAGPQSMRLSVAGERGRPPSEVDIAYDDTARTVVEVEFSRPEGTEASSDADGSDATADHIGDKE